MEAGCRRSRRFYRAHQFLRNPWKRLKPHNYLDQNMNVTKSFILTAAIACLILGTAAGSRAAIISTPGNVLEGRTAFASGAAGNFPASQAIDGISDSPTADNGRIYPDNIAQTLAITGFNSSIGSFRLWTDPSDVGRVPVTLTIYSSSVDYSSDSAAALNVSNYTLLQGFTFTASDYTGTFTGTGRRFLERTLTSVAPEGTRSLFLDFGTGRSSPRPGQVPGSSSEAQGDRISEFQAFAVPEPSTFLTLVSGAAMLGTIRRRRSV